MMIKRMAALIFTGMLIACLAACGRETAISSDTQGSISKDGQTEALPVETERFSVPVTLYLPGENAIGFTTAAALTDGTPAHIVSLLVKEKALPAGVSLLDFVRSGGGSCHADMNAVYGRSLGRGTSGEYQLLGCLVNTLLTHFEQEEITLTIEGETLETGHNVYAYPLRLFE
jgi:hypothetical protein